MGKFAKSQIIEWKVGWKVRMRATGAQLEILGGRTGFLNRGNSINTSCVTYKRRASQRKVFGFFSSK